MKKTSYIGKSREDLIKALLNKRETLRKFSFGTAGSHARNVKEGSALRKEIARIMTELNKKEVGSKK